MKLSRKQFARASLVAVAALALAVPAWAGQVNLGARTTLILETITELGASTNSSTISATGVTEAGGGSISSTATSSINIVEIFNSASATVSFEVAQEDLNYTSPFDNLVITSLIQQSVTVASASGLTNVQVTAGAGNVSVASNGLLSGIALGSITGTLGQSFAAGGTQVLTLAITPGFALQNSNANALTQAAAVAVAGGAAGAAVTALDIQQSGVNEYSPHGNMALIGASINQVVGATTTGITNIGVQAGAGNVMAAHTNVLFHTGPSQISASISQ